MLTPSYPILFLFIIKQNAYKKLIVLNTKAIFIKVKVGRFIKSFDKGLLGKYINIIYNGQTRKQMQILY